MTITDSEILNDLAQEAAGNWSRFAGFSWHNAPDDPENFCIVEIDPDDSLTEISNVEAIKKELEILSRESPDVLSQNSNHHRAYWIERFAVRVFREDGTITEAFKRLAELQYEAENGNIIDEEDYQQREYEATLENIQCEAGRWVREDAPDDWSAKVYEWLEEYWLEELQNNDDQGARPSEKALKEALEDLEFFDWTIPGEGPAMQAIRRELQGQELPGLTYPDSRTVYYKDSLGDSLCADCANKRSLNPLWSDAEGSFQCSICGKTFEE